MAYCDLETLYTNSPPPFGEEMRQHFALDPDYVNLNNGSWGTPPKAVLQSVFEMTQEIEAKPDQFYRYGYKERLKAVRAQLANMIKVHPDECFLVNNATTGMSTVMRNFEWKEGDLIIVFNTSYPSTRGIGAYLSDVPPFPRVLELQLNFPLTKGEVLQEFKTLLASSSAQVGPGNKRVAIIDSIVSYPNLLMPWQDMVRIARKVDVWSVVDAAHSIGQEPDINLSEASPDFWTSTCNKWLYAKRSCAVLYIPFRHQKVIKTTLPTANNYIPFAKRKGDPNLLAQFEWVGTQDFTPFLSIREALRFREWVGGERRINEYCHNLAVRGGRRVAEILGTQVMDPYGNVTLSITNVELPLPSSVRDTPEFMNELNRRLIEEYNVFSLAFFHNKKWWTRISAQIFNDIDDFERLGRAWYHICQEIKDTNSAVPEARMPNA